MENNLYLQKSILNEPILQSLLSENFDATDFVFSAISNSKVDSLFPILTSLQQELSVECEDLLQQSFIEMKADLENINSCKGNFESLSDSIKDMAKLQKYLESNFSREFGEISRNAQILKNSGETEEICEQALSFLQSMKILKTMGTHLHLKSTEHYYVVQKILNEGKINSLDFVSCELEFLDNFRKSGIEKSFSSLHTSLMAKNLKSLHNSLQLLFNFHSLDVSLQNYVNTTLKECSNEMKGLLSLKDKANFLEKFRNLMSFLENCSERIYILSFSLDFLESHSLTKFGEILKSKGVESLFRVFFEKLWKNIFLQSLVKLSQNKESKYVELFNIFIEYIPSEISAVTKVFENLQFSLLNYYFVEGIQTFCETYEIYNGMNAFIDEYWVKMEEKFLIYGNDAEKLLNSNNYKDISSFASNLKSYYNFVFKQNTQQIYFFKKSVEKSLNFFSSLFQQMEKNNDKSSKREINILLFIPLIKYFSSIIYSHPHYAKLDSDKKESLKFIRDFDNNPLISNSKELYLKYFIEKSIKLIRKLFIKHYEQRNNDISMPNDIFDEYSDALTSLNLKHYEVFDSHPSFYQSFERIVRVICQLFTILICSYPKVHSEMGSLEFEFFQGIVERLSLRKKNKDISEFCLKLYKIILLDGFSIQYMIESDSKFSIGIKPNTILISLLCKNKMTEFKDFSEILQRYLEEEEIQFSVDSIVKTLDKELREEIKNEIFQEEGPLSQILSKIIQAS